MLRHASLLLPALLACSPAPQPAASAEPTRTTAAHFEDPPPAPVKKSEALLNKPTTIVAPQPGAAPEEPAPALDPASPLLKPALATAQAPAKFTAKLTTTRGDILIDVTREWAPLGADRFYNLVKIGYFDDTAFFRVVEGFMAQIGIHGVPAVNAAWRPQRIMDDPVKQSNTRGMVTFATSGKDSRVNQFFINLVDNSRLDGMGFAPFGKVRDMAAADKLHAGYGEGAPSGRGPMQARIQNEGNPYLKHDFPNLDYIVKAVIE